MAFVAVDEVKKCRVCGEHKPLSRFSIRADRGLPLHKCKPCQNLYAAAWRKANPENTRRAMRRHDLKRAFGITPEEYEMMWFAQGGQCAACSATIDGRKSKAPAVDHDDKTGKVRGLLCQPCNFALGHTKDSPATLRALAAYLERTI